MDHKHTDEFVSKLSTGLVHHYEPHLKKVKTQLDELIKKQNNLIMQLKEENEMLSTAQSSKDMQEMFSIIQLYHAKLTAIKKEMVYIHERIGKLKKRAVKLQAWKQKELIQREQEKELQLQREQELVAKSLPAPSASSSARKS